MPNVIAPTTVNAPNQEPELSFEAFKTARVAAPRSDDNSASNETEESSSEAASPYTTRSEPAPESAPASQERDPKGHFKGKETATPTTETTEEKVTPGVQKRIDRLTFEKRELERKLAESQGSRPAASEATPETKTAPPAAVDTDPEPTGDKNPATGKPWGNWAEYRDAQRAWDRRQAVREVQALNAQERQFTELKSSWENAVSEAKQSDEYKDIDEVLSASTESKLPTAIARAAIASPEGPKVLYYLAKNPDVVADLSKMNDFDQVRGFALIEAQLTTKATSAAPQPRPAVSRAPKPTATVSTASAASDSTSTSAKSFDEFRRRRETELRNQS